MKPFDLKDPEGHLERVEKTCLKKGLRKDEEKALELVTTFTKGDAKTLYRNWVDEQEKTSARGPADWLKDTYGEGRKTIEDLRSIVDRSKEKRWTAERFRNKFTEAYEKREPTITDAEGARLFVKGLPTRVREVLESNKDLFDDETDQYKVPLMKLVHATRGKKAKRVDRKGKGKAESDGSDGDRSEETAEDTSESDLTGTSSEESSSEEEGKGTVEKREGRSSREKRRKRGKRTKWGRKSKHRTSVKKDDEVTKGLRKEIERLKEERTREGRKVKRGKTKGGKGWSEQRRRDQRIDGTNEGAGADTSTTPTPHLVGGPPYSGSRPPRPPLDPDRPRNCYVCDSTEHQTRSCPVFDELVKLGWPLKKENGYVVVRTEDGVSQDVGVGYGRGGIAGVLVQKFPHLQVKPAVETGNVRMAVLELRKDEEIRDGERKEWLDWQRRYGRGHGEGGIPTGKVYASRIVVDAAGGSL
ncbi:hypothetical protein BC829DRAFT_422375 [Chytridium lagenaria]|nr:hypothetical protein BC829DRAFT_422375 [Chytridium lagenaria]